MKLGVTLRRLDEDLLARFDVVLFPIRQVTGQTKVEIGNPKVRPVISCFGHTVAATKFPDRVAISEDGLPALPGRQNLRDGFAWGWVCPNSDDHKSELLDFVRQVVSGNWDGLHLDSAQFPDANYCHCDRCKSKFAQSNLGDWHEWRASVITGWVATVAKEVGGPISLTVHPDPYFLRERFGTDLERLSPFLEWVMVPIYCLTYDLTYWIDTLLYAFVRFSPVPIFVELYAVEPKPFGLLKALATVVKYPVSGVIFYDPRGEKVKEIAEILREDKETIDLVRSHPDRNFRKLAEQIAERW